MDTGRVTESRAPHMTLKPDFMENIKAQVMALPEVGSWSQMTSVFERAGTKPRPDWELPLLSCQAVGGKRSSAVVGAAAVACMYISIILVDDMLDDDPRGEHLRIGYGPAANLALAFQAAAFRLIGESKASKSCQAAVSACLAQLALATAQGQHLDIQTSSDEQHYWQVVQAKSTPYYRAALQVGALLGDAGPQIVEEIGKIGVLIGEICQLHDDLFDAFAAPANPDWLPERNNLPILYASTANHTDRERFHALRPKVDDPQRLEECQQILITCGAVSYCAYHLIRRHQEVHKLIDQIALVDPQPIKQLLDQQTKPLTGLLRTCKAELSSEWLKEPVHDSTH